MLKKTYSKREHGIVENIYEYLLELSNLQCSQQFREPVDAVKLNIPDYYIKITNPMDLQTLRENFKNGQYKTLEELKTEFNFIISNCQFYNSPPPPLPPHPICKKADELDQAFKTRIQSLQKLMVEKNIDEKEEFSVDKERLIEIQERKKKKKPVVDIANILDPLPNFVRQASSNIIPVGNIPLPSMNKSQIENSGTPSNIYSYNESPSSQNIDNGFGEKANLEKVENMLNQMNDKLLNPSKIVESVQTKNKELPFELSSSLRTHMPAAPLVMKKQAPQVLTEEQKESLAISFSKSEIEVAFNRTKVRKEAKIKKILGQILRKLAKIFRLLRDKEMPDCQIISHFLRQFLDDALIDIFVRDMNAIKLILLEKEVIHFIKSKKNSIKEKFQKKIIEYLQQVEKGLQRALSYNLIVLNEDLFRTVSRDLQNINEGDDQAPDKSSSAIFINSGYERELKAFKKLVQDSFNKDGTKIKFSLGEIHQSTGEDIYFPSSTAQSTNPFVIGISSSSIIVNNNNNNNSNSNNTNNNNSNSKESSKDNNNLSININLGNSLNGSSFGSASAGGDGYDAFASQISGGGNAGSQGSQFLFDFSQKKASGQGMGGQGSGVVEFQRPINMGQSQIGQTNLGNSQEKGGGGAGGGDDNQSTLITISTKKATTNQNDISMNRYFNQNREIFGDQYLKLVMAKRLERKEEQEVKGGNISNQGEQQQEKEGEESMNGLERLPIELNIQPFLLGQQKETKEKKNIFANLEAEERVGQTVTHRSSFSLKKNIFEKMEEEKEKEEEKLESDLFQKKFQVLDVHCIIKRENLIERSRFLHKYLRICDLKNIRRISDLETKENNNRQMVSQVFQFQFLYRKNEEKKGDMELEMSKHNEFVRGGEAKFEVQFKSDLESISVFRKEFAKYDQFELVQRKFAELAPQMEFLNQQDTFFMYQEYKFLRTMKEKRVSKVSDVYVGVSDLAERWVSLQNGDHIAYFQVQLCIVVPQKAYDISINSIFLSQQ